ncbi:MAG: RNA polymerase sigma factor [Acidobacteria bacterium]|nr:RNA polymerase sigma factor [Acidobacteriota bacterium]
MSPSAEWSDIEVYRRSQAGNESAFAALYRRFQGPVFRFALRMSGSESVAEEVTQEVFLFLLREPGRYRPEAGALGAFLIGVARNHLRRHLERRRRTVGLEEDVPAGDAGGPGVEFERRNEVEVVRRAISALPAGYREVVVLCELGETSYEEAAAALGCPIGTVRSRLNRARALLRARLARARERARCLA